MAQIHVVSAGEHASSIAARYGFPDFETIWAIDANTRLRELRKDPHQLVEGDQVVIPGQQRVAYKRVTGSTHEFRVKVEKLKLRLKLCNTKQEPLPNTPCKLSLGRGIEELMTDGDGMLEVPVPRDCDTGTIEVDERQYRLRVGALEPITTYQGQVARLMNLGFWYGDDDDREDPEALALAIELFQAEQGLNATGEADMAFTDALARLHDGRA